MAENHKPRISVVVPFFNEQECVRDVCEEILDVLRTDFGEDGELIAVDDGSDDDTVNILINTARGIPAMRIIKSRYRLGQSAALKLGFEHCSADIVATMDGDGQNDPGDIKRLLKKMELTGADMVNGVRTARRDKWIRRISGRIANMVRSGILKDNTSDVGCAIRVFRRHCLADIHLFRNFHRFFPALFVMNGYAITEMPVNHRPRLSGTSKYGGGIRSRLWVGLVDLSGVYWLSKRVINPRAVQVEGEE